jgi:hypothetical protein
MKNVKFIPLLALVVSLAAGSALAQLANQKVMANIPFDFRVGDRLMPAGEYNISAATDNGTLALLGPEAQFVSSHAAQLNAPSTATKLVFKKASGRYFLSQIWVEGEQRGRELASSRMEREVAKNQKPELVTILARK